MKQDTLKNVEGLQGTEQEAIFYHPLYVLYALMQQCLFHVHAKALVVKTLSKT
jgi:hypothetical protein